jgi:hypothetical protein
MRVRDDTFQPIQTGRNEVECLYLTAEPGTTAEQAIRSAIITCLRYDVEVKVQHNDEVWHFTPIAMIATVRSTQKGIDTSDRKVRRDKAKIKKEVEAACAEFESGSGHKGHDILLGLLEDLG